MGKNGYIEKIRPIGFLDRLDVGGRVGDGEMCVKNDTNIFGLSNWKLD